MVMKMRLGTLANFNESPASKSNPELWSTSREFVVKRLKLFFFFAMSLASGEHFVYDRPGPQFRSIRADSCSHTPAVAVSRQLFV